MDVKKFSNKIEGNAIRDELEIPLDAPVAGIVGRLDHVKGHGYFIEAAAMVLKDVPEACFMVVGTEVNIKTAELKDMANSLGVADRFGSLLQMLDRTHRPHFL